MATTSMDDKYPLKRRDCFRFETGTSL